ncbi:arad-like aldolase/epimerase [Crassisporium funariophilum]|nr:arad-like aldolase/epimerase [Crassisporium funariophilum]
MFPYLSFSIAVLSLLATFRIPSVYSQTTPQPQATSSPSANVQSAALDLLDANHILHFLDIIDAFGHISVRNPDNASQFIMSFAIAPALTTSQSLVTYDITNATALHLTFNSSITGASVPSSFLERFIHSQIYQAYPNVTSVVHAHTSEVLPFAGVGIGLKAQMGTAGSVGVLKNGSPIFDTNLLSSKVLPDNQPHDLLIRNEVLGDALAHTFADGSQVVLMKGHGMAIRGASIRDAVYRSFYTKQSAVVQFQAVLLGSLSPGGQQPMGLTARQAMDAATTNEGESLIDRAWGLWVAQVGNAGLYVNDLRGTASA